MRDGEQFRGVFCFEGFEINSRSGELRKFGRKLRLQDQPFRLLSLLIERQGEVVTREDLKAKLWPADTFVDFDHGLNSAVARVREVLNDSAATPRFIETVPKRGYRFLAQVELRSAAPELPVAGAMSPSDDKVEPFKARSRRFGWVALGCMVVAIVTVGMELLRPKALALPRIARIAQLTNDGQLKGTSASDGVRLYFEEKIAEKFLLKQVSVHGGEVSTVNPTWGPITIYDLSPNRSELLVGGDIQQSGMSLWTVSLPSGSPRPLKIVVDDASWMHDGSKIVYAKGKEIYVASSDGIDTHRIAIASGEVSAFGVSPDGKRLRFTTYDDEKATADLSELSLQDGSITSLTPDWKESDQPCCGVWSPDGRYYFFQTHQDAKTLDGDIWVLSGESGRGRAMTATALTHGPLALGKLSMDPSGRALFARGSLARAQLVRYDAATSTLVPYLGGISATDVAISRDKQWVTYVTYPEFELWRSRLDGTEKRRLSFGATVPFLPRWSPDGKEIAFADIQDRKPSKIEVLSRDGGPVRVLLPDDRYSEGDVNWASDGKSIVFTGRYSNGEPGIYQFEFETRKVTRMPESEKLTSSRTSPDGRYVAALSEDWKKLLLFDNRTKHWSEIFHVESGVIGFENFSSDGKYVQVARMDLEQGYGILKVAVASGKVVSVTDLKNVAMPDPTWSGLSADDEPLIRIDKSTREIYRLDLQFP